MSHWKVAGVEVNPNGYIFYFHSPSRVMNAAFSWVSGLRETCQYPPNKSKVLKYLLPAKASKNLPIRGKG